MFQRRLLARIDEDECSLHGVILAAGLIALSRTVKASCERRGDSETGNANLFSVSNRSDPSYCIIFLKFITRQGEVDLHVARLQLHKNALKWARQCASYEGTTVSRACPPRWGVKIIFTQAKRSFRKARSKWPYLMLYSFNLRNYFKTYVPKHGNLTGHYEQSFAVPPDIDDVSEFWKLAHDLNLKLQVNRAFYSRLLKISQ